MSINNGGKAILLLDNLLLSDSLSKIQHRLPRFKTFCGISCESFFNPTEFVYYMSKYFLVCCFKIFQNVFHRNAQRISISVIIYILCWGSVLQNFREFSFDIVLLLYCKPQGICSDIWSALLVIWVIHLLSF